MSKRPYSTHDELAFLDGLVKSAWVSNVSRARILKSLKNYAKTATNRAWPEGVDGEACKGYAEVLIGKLQKG